jgi:TonB family protein
MNDLQFDFNFLIDEQKSLPTRLIREITSQAREFRSDPKGYIKSSLANDSIGRKRGRLLLFGMAVGTICLSSVILMAALFYYSQARPNVARNATSNIDNVVPLVYPADIQLESLKNGEDRAHGGGGSGNHELTPPSYGVRPPDSLTPTITVASAHPPVNPNPLLPVTPTILAQPIPIPDQLKNLPFGLPTGPIGPPSNGPGNGSGIGTGNGHGIGSGTGDGEGAGSGGNRGGGPRNNATGNGENPDSDPPFSSKLQILTKPRPDYTEQARTQKVQGVVVIEATFRADGEIADARVIRGLGYGLDEKAIQAVMQIKFRPAERKGRPVDARQRINVSFQLL